MRPRAITPSGSNHRVYADRNRSTSKEPTVQVRRRASRPDAVASAAQGSQPAQRSGRYSAALVAGGLIATGLLVNGYLAVTAHALSPGDYLYFGSYWSLALVIGLGVYLPIEQELAHRIHQSPDWRPQARVAAQVAGAWRRPNSSC